MKLLFIGDSITDAGRDRADPRSLGTGYVNVIASHLRAALPDSGHTVTNRGVSGDRAPAVEARWNRDCLELAPDVITLLVGVNDTWRRFDSNDPSPISAYEASLRNILRRTTETTTARVILMDPFALHVPPVTEEWDSEMHARREIVHILAEEFTCSNVRLQSAFDATARTRDPFSLLSDGVHPTTVGHELIASEWLAVFQQG